MYNRSKTLKHTRSDPKRATKVGVNHKFCSIGSLEVSLKHQKEKSKIQKEKCTRLSSKVEELLHKSWHDSKTPIPFLQTLHSLIEEKKLSDFDLSFLKNWAHKKDKGNNWKADEQARFLAILYSNKLGKKNYSELAPILGLPGECQVQRIRSKETNEEHYLPGINEWAIKKVSQRLCRPLQNGMDGTRVIRTIELYLDHYLIGEEFPTDVRLFPKEAELPRLENADQVKEYISNVRQKNRYAAEAYSFNITDTTGTLSDMLIGSIPEAKKGVTGGHIFGIMMEIEKYSKAYNLSLVGHCTDSASNSLNALITLALPKTYKILHLSKGIKFIGLNMKGFVFCAPILRKNYPSIAYPCWDHSSRTSLRNLMNENIKIVAEVLPKSADGIKRYSIATIQDLKALKAKQPNIKVRHADITSHVRQNCDATARVLSRGTIEDLTKFLPSAKATKLYLQASLWIHEPFRNEKFGSPKAGTRSLWAGIMTIRRWRSYIVLTDDVTLRDNWISRGHYMTLELMAHAGIIHQLALYLSFPELNTEDYFLRNTGNRGIEALHSIFQGGTGINLPITSANLSFREFLNKMNKILQIKAAEHSLQKISGHTVTHNKKKKIIYAKESNEKSCSDVPYTKPKTYREFLEDLVSACKEGDDDSKKLLEELTPNLAESLKKHGKWLSPHLSIEEEESIPLILNDDDWSDVDDPTGEIFDQLISYSVGHDLDLGEVVNSSDSEQHTLSIDMDDETTEALGNLLFDTDGVYSNDLSSNSGKKKHFIKHLQPHRELPSKDRSKRFMAGHLYGDQGTPADHNVQLFQFWAINLTKPILQKAHTFLIGQIIFMVHSGKTCLSHQSTNTNLEVIFEIFKYDADNEFYTRDGRSGLLKANRYLLLDITNDIICQEGESIIRFDHTKIQDLSDYIPFHEDVDIEARLSRTDDSTTQYYDNNDDQYTVEMVIDKRFHRYRNQYEFLVKWIG